MNSTGYSYSFEIPHYDNLTLHGHARSRAHLHVHAWLAIYAAIGHYLLDSCFSSENFQDGMRAGGSLPLPIIHIFSFYYQNLVK